MGENQVNNNFLGDQDENDDYLFSISSKKGEFFFVKSYHQFFISKGAIFVGPQTRVVRIDFDTKKNEAIFKFLVYGKENFARFPLSQVDILKFVKDFQEEIEGDISPSIFLSKLQLFEKFFTPKVNFTEIKLGKNTSFEKNIYVKFIGEIFEEYRGIEVPIKQFTPVKKEERGSIPLTNAIHYSAKSIRNFI